jgi:hypothetical protein
MSSNPRFSQTLKKVYWREVVKRSQLLRIAATWVITVPVSALWPTYPLRL